MTRSRLAPGTGIVTVPGAAPVLRTSGGEFLRIDTGGVTGEALVRRLTGEETSDGRAPGEDPHAAELARLVEAFEAAWVRGIRSAPGSARRPHRSPPR